MRKIEKTPAPDSFLKWVKQKPHDKSENQWFKAIYEQEQWNIVEALSRHNTIEQYYLCAYCCDRISGSLNDTVNEHVEARACAPRRSLDPGNIVASCKTSGQCDSAHKNQALPLTPLMPECETELRFKFSGRVEGLTERAIEAIRVLNLGDNRGSNKALIAKRKYLVDALIWSNYEEDPNNLALEDDCELLEMLVADLQTPQDGKLEPFAPVLVNIVRNLI